ncbi:Phosphoribosylglycinamide formyltransferase [Serinicoccus hydrothermalis]|uniref:Phosphoribosylglycinamide formyltransferase n=1 Tax=Serinicoccus hydrothermalis TaxID=1758689 RepID=A0A1B1NGC1_9MICO|nr:phosphoribosylglycinamide formyltransferase [Serinicoccus hydrothermalis]ANS80472.1 Phosphoribosylglycinamide formyltransferase [Serinicoccus hydrothermalis]
MSTSHPPARVVVLVSGSGTLLQAVLDACDDPGYAVRVVAVGADREGIAGLERARARGIPTFVERLGDHPDRAAWDAALADRLAEHRPDLVLSAGFMKILGAQVLATQRVVNTHPALLPSFPGAHAVRDALDHGVRVSGATLHLVDAGVDTGPILAQRAVEVRTDDTEETLHERIKVAEREMLVAALPGLARVHPLDDA